MSGDVRMTWAGKRAPIAPEPPPHLQCVESCARSGSGDRGNRLIQGDNLAIMAALLPELSGRIDLIYLDPPFFTGKQWSAGARVPRTPASCLPPLDDPAPDLQGPAD